jgi:thioredoxin-like negative regulator of GroEL
VVIVDAVTLPDPAQIDAFLASGAALGILFTAPWCAAGELLVKLLAADPPPATPALLTVDCDGLPHVADRFAVRTLPTFVVMDGLKEKGRLVGAFSPADVRTLLGKVAR